MEVERPPVCDGLSGIIRLVFGFRTTFELRSLRPLIRWSTPQSPNELRGLVRNSRPIRLDHYRLRCHTHATPCLSTCARTRLVISPLRILSPRPPPLHAVNDSRLFVRLQFNCMNTRSIHIPLRPTATHEMATGCSPFRLHRFRSAPKPWGALLLSWSTSAYIGYEGGSLSTENASPCMV